MSTSPAPLLSSLLPAAPGTRLTVEQTVQVINEEVAIRVAQPGIHTRPEIDYLTVADEAWTWEQIRNYVITEIEKVIGVFPRDTRKEMGIFKSFLDRWGELAAPIARYAFQNAHGYWKNAPVSVNRFCRNSDPYFSAVIAAHIAEVRQAQAIKA